MNKNIAIIGAGLAGGTLAQRLHQQGYTVTLFEKSRGVGGRLSSCRLPSGEADLGAPTLTELLSQHSPQNSAYTDWLVDQGSVEPWLASLSDFNDATHQEKYTETLLVHEQKQSRLIRTLIKGCTLHTSTRIKHLVPEKQGCSLIDNQGKALGSFSRVIVTAPAPQAVELLNKVPQFSKIAAQIKTYPTWVSIICLETPTAIDTDIFCGSHPTFARIIRDTSKPNHQSGDNTEAWYLEANRDWSTAHQSAAIESVSAQLLSEFKLVVKKPIKHSFQRTHRWLYAGHGTVHSEPFLLCDKTGIGACGDWLGATGLEGAWQSGDALANAILEADSRG